MARRLADVEAVVSKVSIEPRSNIEHACHFIRNVLHLMGGGEVAPIVAESVAISSCLQLTFKEWK